ncbi:hypothetical protein EUZ85_18650 [Hahella sp. KA22]|uniref:hypothetical protein n=1 Tax=Hahella sp. KA22 TaxID=1628392 RepID=UPI000FDDD4F6|nr:hypothetical protein [Hahella sp. KA22]AZZ92635.1 hypothetical protein ENC22_16075 [Hahella sp. KA22]QAY56008.1 hypothetical protein EUZ85_18650 [Hahella sp. KA22]
MSEFSESYHLRTKNKEEGKDLLKRLGVRGIVFDESNNWVTILPEGDLNSQKDNVAANYNGMVLHYMFAEDHAWVVNLFSNGVLISAYVCAWDPELYIEKDKLDVQRFVDLLIDQGDREKLIQLFCLDTLDDIFSEMPAYKLADLLGIEHYQWLAGHDIPRHGEEIVRSNPGAELVG